MNNLNHSINNSPSPALILSFRLPSWDACQTIRREHTCTCAHTHTFTVSGYKQAVMPWGMHSIRGKIHTDMLRQDYESKTSAQTWEPNTPAHSLHQRGKLTPEQLSEFWSSLQSNICLKHRNKHFNVQMTHTWLPMSDTKSNKFTCVTLMPTIFWEGQDCLIFIYHLNHTVRGPV